MAFWSNYEALNIAEGFVSVVSRMGVENIDEDRKRAEVFDALSHPTRIMLLKALNDEPLGFADLKKKLGIESSGHLQHHISKLDGLIKTDETGKYTLSDQGKDALHSVNTVESAAGVKTSKNKKAHILRENSLLKSTVIILAVLLALSSTMAAFQYINSSSLQSEIGQLNEVIVDQDTQVAQLDTATRLAQSMLRLKLPSDSKYLSTHPAQNNQGQTTKILLNNTGASCAYGKSTVSSFNPTLNEPTEDKIFSFTFENWRWRFNVGETFGEPCGDAPSLTIGATVRNDYTSADAEAYIGNKSGSYRSLINLGITFYTSNGSIVEVPKVTVAHYINSNTAVGGKLFPLVSGQTKEVIFYLSPTVSDIEAIDHFEIYVSSLSPY